MRLKEAVRLLSSQYFDLTGAVSGKELAFSDAPWDWFDGKWESNGVLDAVHPAEQCWELAEDWFHGFLLYGPEAYKGDRK
jgi:hypothetical protein